MRTYGCRSHLLIFKTSEIRLRRTRAYLYKPRPVLSRNKAANFNSQRKKKASKFSRKVVKNTFLTKINISKAGNATAPGSLQTTTCKSRNLYLTFSCFSCTPLRNLSEERHIDSPEQPEDQLLDIWTIFEPRRFCPVD